MFPSFPGFFQKKRGKKVSVPSFVLSCQENHLSGGLIGSLYLVTFCGREETHSVTRRTRCRARARAGASLPAGQVLWPPVSGLGRTACHMASKAPLCRDLLTFPLFTLGKDPVPGEYPRIEKHFLLLKNGFMSYLLLMNKE